MRRTSVFTAAGLLLAGAVTAFAQSPTVQAGQAGQPVTPPQTNQMPAHGDAGHPLNCLQQREDQRLQACIPPGVTPSASWPFGNSTADRQG